MNEAVENVIVRESDECPVPARAPGDFTVIIGAVLAGGTMEGLKEEMAALGGVEGAVSLLLTWFEWVEAEVRRFPDLVEELMRLRGQVMSLGAAWAGEWQGDEPGPKDCPGPTSRDERLERCESSPPWTCPS